MNKRSTIPAVLVIFMLLTSKPDAVRSQGIEHPIRLPAFFQEELVYLQPVTDEGDTLRFFTDTADATLIYREIAEEHGLITTDALIQDEMQNAAFLPRFDTTRFIPPPLISDGLIPVRENEQMPPHHEFILRQGDGILGSTWFAGRTWSINFRDETFYVRPTGEYNRSLENIADEEDNTVIPLHFYEEEGTRFYHFARLLVTIGGESLSMVLKTGSNIILNENVQDVMGRDAALIPAGLIAENVFEQWREDHPDWPVYEEADANYGSAMIEVPEVQIGNHTAGPVHFAVRQPDDLQGWFSQFTDEPVVGALGADALRGTHITLDYPNALLIFHD